MAAQTTEWPLSAVRAHRDSKTFEHRHLTLWLADARSADLAVGGFQTLGQVGDLVAQLFVAFAVELRPGRGPCQPCEDDQEADVRTSQPPNRNFRRTRSGGGDGCLTPRTPTVGLIGRPYRYDVLIPRLAACR